MNRRLALGALAVAAGVGVAVAGGKRLRQIGETDMTTVVAFVGDRPGEWIAATPEGTVDRDHEGRFEVDERFERSADV
ncbi:hypothetical protein [Natronorarus salvus]|uniref:hypothetical protein n=1 Tax=Natronorarus salvus TaxID=3117733 RepID=UPI002F26BCC4